MCENATFVRIARIKVRALTWHYVWARHRRRRRLSQSMVPSR